MKVRHVRALLGALLIVGVVQSARGADDEGWITLFDGKSLDGWEISENPESWSVVDGAIQAKGDRSHLFYKGREFKDFVLSVDVMTEPGSNGGIYIHTGNQGEGWPEKGYEIQVNVTHGDPVKTGSVYNVVKLYETPAKDNKWWTQEITVKGKNIVVRIDGKVVLDFTEPDGVRGPRKLSEGLVALQAHDPKSVVKFKNIKAKPLD